jgi:hypothetical protein
MMSVAALADAPPPPPKATTLPLAGTFNPDGQQVYLMNPAEGNPAFGQERSFGRPELFYFSAEYLLWWERGMRLPPLVTTAPANQEPEMFRGALNQPGTQLLFGGNTQPAQLHSGARFTAGVVLDDCGDWAVEGSYFFLGKRSSDFVASSDQFPVLARPIFDIILGVPSRQLTASPGTAPGDAFSLKGSISVHSDSSFSGFEANVRRIVCNDCNYTFSLLAGFRFQELDEGLHIREDVTSLKAVPGTNLFDPGTKILVFDNFDTRNRFYGGQVGANFEWRTGNWFIGSSVKLGVGDTAETVNIQGGQLFTLPNGTKQQFPGGLLAVSSNIGRHNRDEFGFITDVGLKAGYQINDQLRVFVGYEFMYWNSVLRPGDQVDTVVNVNLVPNFVNPPLQGPNANVQRPAVLFRTSDFWVQGMRFGLEYHY